MSVIHRKAIAGVCLPALWYQPNEAATPQSCPDVLLIGVNVVAETIRAKANLNGLGYFGIGCALPSGYVRFPNVFEGYTEVTPYDPNAVLMVDVWGALRDGIWTSSTTIEVRVVTSIAPRAATIYTHPRNTITDQVNKAITSEATLGGSCGSVLQATITVNDDGTFSIA